VFYSVKGERNKLHDVLKSRRRRFSSTSGSQLILNRYVMRSRQFDALELCTFEKRVLMFHSVKRISCRTCFEKE
jgi:hypothetical protein